MVMRIGVLTARDGWHLADLKRAAEEQPMEVLGLDFRALSASVYPSEESFACGQVSVHELDLLLVRAMPAGTLEQVVYRMDVLNRLQSRGVRIVNPPRAIECAVDKYLALARLAAHEIPVPRTRLSEQAHRALDDFFCLGEDVVVKPLFGSEGRGMMRLSHPDLAERTFRALEQLGAVIYQQEFLPHPGWDYRVLVVGDRVVAAMRRSAGESSRDAVDREWRTNIACGGHGEAVRPPEEVTALAREAADVVGARLVGVDILPDNSGKHRVIEVNAAPGWRTLAKVSGTDIATEILHYLKGLCCRQ